MSIDHIFDLYILTSLQLADELASGPDDGVLGPPVAGRENAAASLVYLAARVAAVLAQVEDGALVARHPPRRALRLGVCEAGEERDEEDRLHLRPPLVKCWDSLVRYHYL